jgi:hypothetical protein
MSTDVVQTLVVPWHDPDAESKKLHVTVSRFPATRWIEDCWFWSEELHLKYEFTEGAGGMRIENIRKHPKLTREEEERILEEADKQWEEFRTQELSG